MHVSVTTRAVVDAPAPRGTARAAHARVGHIVPLEPAAASTEVIAVYHDFQRRMGFRAVPNFIKTQGHSLAATRGSWALVESVLVGGVLPRTVKEMLFVAISKARACRYCEAAHLACCRMLGIELSALERLVSNVTALSPPKVRDIIRFGLKCAGDPQSLTERDFEELRHHGLGTSEIMELIAMSALAVYANTIADATGMASDEMFAEH